MYCTSRWTLSAKKPAAATTTNRKTTFSVLTRSVPFPGVTYRARQRRHDLEHVPDDTVVRDLEDGCFGILVDGDNGLGRAHAGQMLDSTGDADGDVQLWAHLPAGLSDLIGVGAPAFIRHCA